MSCIWWTECGRIFNLAVRGAVVGATSCAAIFGAALLGHDAAAADKPKLGLGSKAQVIQPKHPGNQPGNGNNPGPGNGGGLGTVARADASKPKIGIAPATFDIQTGTKDFEAYGKEIVVNSPTTVVFRMITKVAGVTAAKWQVSEQPFTLNGPVPPLKKEGAVSPIPAVNHQTWINISFQGVLPATPPSQMKSYYVRLFVTSAAYPQGIGLPQVVVKHVKPGAPPKFTTKGLMPELWNPMKVQVDFSSMNLINADESDEEPFLIAFVLWVDGTTINPLNFPGSSVRIDSPTQVHGNLKDYDSNGKDLSSGDYVQIPSSFDTTRSILPIGLDLVDFPGVGPDLLMNNTKVYVVVMALEEDATADSAAQAARNALASGLTSEVNGIIKGMTLGQTPAFDLAAIQSKLQDQAISAAKANTLSGMWNPIGAMLALDDLIDPDDFIGAGVQSYSYKQLKNSGPGGLKIELDLKKGNSVHYKVNGTVRKVN